MKGCPWGPDGKTMDLSWLGGQEFSQFPQELYSTEFIQRGSDKNLGVWAAQGQESVEECLPRGQSKQLIGRHQMGRSRKKLDQILLPFFATHFLTTLAKPQVREEPPV